MDKNEKQTAGQPAEDRVQAGQSSAAEQHRQIRHTISAEETFTLAKDVYDLRSFFKSVYLNRAVIARRLNLFSLVLSLLFTMVYTGYAVYSILTNRITSLGMEIAIYCMLGIYAVFVILLVLVSVCAGDATTRTVKKYNKALKIFRMGIRLISIAMAIVALAIGSDGDDGTLHVTLETVLVIISIIVIIVQAIPLLFGGFANIARWALSPAKGKTRFSVVLLEWYGLVRNGAGTFHSTSRISPRYVEDINRCIDSCLIPALGKRYITTIDANAIYSTVDAAPEELKEIAEGIFRRVFEYAEECGYVNHNPARAMELEDSLEEPEKKPRRTMKSRLMRIGKKLGKSIVKSYLEDEEN